jgi:ATP-dependent helicase/nuclease subunit A
MRAVAPAAEDFAAWRRRNGRLNYQDLLLLARDLLRDHSAVRRTFQARFLPILVDEFQDTDPIQAEILFYLTGEDTNERDWRLLTPLPGKLFVVGDPKQRRSPIPAGGTSRPMGPSGIGSPGAGASSP